MWWPKPAIKTLPVHVSNKRTKTVEESQGLGGHGTLERGFLI